MLTCVIVDSGVSYNHPLVNRDALYGFSLSFGQDGNSYYSDDFDDQYGHGTAIYNILQDLKDSVKFINIKLSSIEEDMVDEDALISALEYIEREYHDVNVINLSLGVTISDRQKDLYDICKRFDDNGTVILSAFDNEGAMSFPATFDCVIGVTSLDECKKNDDFIYIDDSCINLAAKGGIQKLAWKEPHTVFMNGNSFACAHATKQTLKILLAGEIGRTAVLQKFQSLAIDIRQFIRIQLESKKVFPKSGRIAIFPFNKEMHSFIRYKDVLPFEITKVYDLKYSGKVLSTTNKVLQDDCLPCIKIENINDIDFDAFDSFVFGHFCEIEQMVAPDFRKQLLDRLKNQDKLVFSFDDIEKLGMTYKNIYCPKVNTSDVIPNRLGKLFRISKPVLGVFGTSSSQGKFTLQLKLRTLFMKHDYKIGQIGSEPQSELFGMDYAFPMGYNSSVYLNDDETVLHLNSLIYSLCDRDIIIVGSQANTIPYDYGNLSRFTFKQHSFFMGTMPDAVVLVVNPYDESDYIDSTIRYLESFGFCKVVAIVVYPLDIDDNWKRYTYKKRQITIEKMASIRKKYTMNYPVYLMGCDTDEEDLFNHIIEWFSR